MTINVDEFSTPATPWDFKLSIDGKIYLTRPITDGDTIEIGRAFKDGDVSAQRLIVGRLIVGDLPRLSQLGPQARIAICYGAVVYWSKWVRKSIPAMVQKMTEALRQDFPGATPVIASDASATASPGGSNAGDAPAAEKE